MADRPLAHARAQVVRSEITKRARAIVALEHKATKLRAQLVTTLDDLRSARRLMRDLVDVVVEPIVPTVATSDEIPRG